MPECFALPCGCKAYWALDQHSALWHPAAHGSNLSKQAATNEASDPSPRLAGSWLRSWHQRIDDDGRGKNQRQRAFVSWLDVAASTTKTLGHWVPARHRLLSRCSLPSSRLILAKRSRAELRIRRASDSRDNVRHCFRIRLSGMEIYNAGAQHVAATDNSVGDECLAPALQPI